MDEMKTWQMSAIAIGFAAYPVYLANSSNS